MRTAFISPAGSRPTPWSPGCGASSMGPHRLSSPLLSSFVLASATTHPVPSSSFPPSRPLQQQQPQPPQLPRLGGARVARARQALLSKGVRAAPCRAAIITIMCPPATLSVTTPPPSPRLAAPSPPPLHTYTTYDTTTRLFGPVLSFGVKGGKAGGIAFINNVRLASHLANVRNTHVCLKKHEHGVVHTVHTLKERKGERRGRRKGEMRKKKKTCMRVCVCVCPKPPAATCRHDLVVLSCHGPKKQTQTNNTNHKRWATPRRW